MPCTASSRSRDGQGEEISDKTILIYTEQGLGDMILFARYLPMVVQRARRVIVAISPRMRRLLESIQASNSSRFVTFRYRISTCIAHC